MSDPKPDPKPDPKAPEADGATAVGELAPAPGPFRDPYLVLGLAEDADDAAVERAWLDGLKRCPPERDAARFEALRRAYETLRTERGRLAHELFDITPPSVAELLQRIAPVAAPRRPDLATLTAVLRGED